MQVELFSPYDKQLQVLEALENPDYKIVVLVAARQSGKSLLIINYALKEALENRDYFIMIVSPSEQQCIKLHSDAYKALEQTNLIKRSVKSKGVVEIELITGSKIMFKSALAENSLRGNSVHILIIDEAAFISETTFNEILLPCVATIGKKVFMCSTPKGRKNILYKYYVQGQKGIKKQISFKFTYENNPFANKDLIEIFRENLSEQQFNQEFLCEFTDGGGVFKSISKICTGKNTTAKAFIDSLTPTGGCVMGIDIGIKNDRTVISVMDIKSQKQIALISKKKVTTSHIKQVIQDTIEAYKPKKVYIETNNQGLPIYEDLKEIDSIKNVIEPFVTTNTNKAELVNQLIYLFEKRTIELINDEDLKGELENFSFEFLPSGKIRFAAANGKHDDFVMSTLISLAARNEFKNTGKYFIK